MNSTQGSTVPRLFLVAGLICGIAIVAFAYFESSYYTTPIINRPLHPQHPVLRSSGKLGLPFGLIGLALMLLNLTYLIRKRLAKNIWLGPYRNWMAFHVFTGLIGPALILLHVAYVLRSPLATLSFLAMGFVVLTGILGRFIYSQVPRSLKGKELELEDVHRQFSDSLREMSDLGLGESFLIKAGDKPVAGGGASKSFFTLIFELINDERKTIAEYYKFRKMIRKSSELRSRKDEILPLAKRLYRQRQWYSRFHQLRYLMGSWRFVHRWLAVAMLLTVIFHIIVAVKYGDLWIFGGEK